ncbi:MAG TPA: vanadium-dependent haloperoxidase [Vicinamibacteria bacterium]|nr:vanadium-dependent haloperoxidase [Vicinamibacteria bacterium]
MTRLPRLAALAIVCGLSWPSTAQANVVTYWNEVANQAVAAAVVGRPGPPGLLDLALVHAAMHDAVQAIDGRYEPYFASIPGAEGSTEAAAAAAAYGVLAGLYPLQRPGPTGLDQKYANYLAANSLGGNPGLAVGDEAAAALLTQYRPLIPLPAYLGGPEPGQWRPTPPANASGAFEFLRYTKPFTLLRPSQFRPDPPPPLTSGDYLRDYNEVKELGALTGSTRTAAQTDQAHFWSDNFIAQWNRALRAIAEAHVPDIGDSARLFALASLAAADAAITAWESKYHFSFWRPITAIREGDADGNAETVGDPAWTSLIATPPYPDYTSGANNLTGAFTRILELFFGTDEFSFSVTSNAPLAVQKTRDFARFSQAAQEVVEARVYLGIHFRFADTAARAQGRRVAHWAFMRFLRPVPGS